MNDTNKQQYNNIYVRISVLTIGILILAFADVIVIEMIYKPIALKYNIPWNEFEIRLPLLWGDGCILWWHVAFVPLGFILFILAGIPRRDWKLALAGSVLFVTGLEDIAYYIVQLELAPRHLPWLDKSPPIAWTCILTGSEHVTRTGLYIATLTGGILAGAILGLHKPYWHKHR
ncbi:MAG: hypothetical protein ACUZ8E_00580 [Candidatus Anammoxibacter sp.]